MLLLQYGYTPLHEAVAAGKVKYVRLLLDSGATVDLPTSVSDMKISMEMVIGDP